MGGQLGAGAGQREPPGAPLLWAMELSIPSGLPPQRMCILSSFPWQSLTLELHPLGLGGNYLLIELASEPFHVIITQGTQPTIKGEMAMGSQGGVTGRRKSHMDPAGDWHVPRPSAETRGHRGSEKDVGPSGEGENTGPT